jgi:23S rRNA (guanosine2251-2'-O)-methyltransferase
MEQDNQIFGIRAILEAIEAGKDLDKVFIQKEAQGELMNELIKSLKKKQHKFFIRTH